MKNEESQLHQEMNKIKNDYASEHAMLVAAHKDNMQKMKTQWELIVGNIKEELNKELCAKSELEDLVTRYCNANSKKKENCKKLTKELNNTLHAKSDLEAMLDQNRTDCLRVSNKKCHP